MLGTVPGREGQAPRTVPLIRLYAAAAVVLKRGGRKCIALFLSARSQAPEPSSLGEGFRARVLNFLLKKFRARVTSVWSRSALALSPRSACVREAQWFAYSRAILRERHAIWLDISIRAEKGRGVSA